MVHLAGMRWESVGSSAAIRALVQFHKRSFAAFCNSALKWIGFPSLGHRSALDSREKYVCGYYLLDQRTILTSIIRIHKPWARWSIHAALLRMDVFGWFGCPLSLLRRWPLRVALHTGVAWIFRWITTARWGARQITLLHLWRCYPSLSCVEHQYATHEDRPEFHSNVR